MWGKGNPCTLLPGMYVGAAAVENNMEVSQKTKNRTIIWPNSSTLGSISEKTKTLIQKDTCTPCSQQHYLQ